MTKWSRKPPKIAALGPVGRKGIIIMKHLAEGAIREKISSNLRLAVVQNNLETMSIALWRTFWPSRVELVVKRHVSSGTEKAVMTRSVKA